MGGGKTRFAYIHVSQIGFTDELDVKWERKRLKEYPRFGLSP